MKKIFKKFMYLTVALTIAVSSLGASSVVLANRSSSQETTIVESGIVIKEFQENLKEISCTLVYNNGIYEEESIIEGIHYPSPSEGSKDRVVKITNNTSSNIVSLKYNDNQVIVYLLDGSTKELKAYSVQREASILDKSFLNSFESIEKESPLDSTDRTSYEELNEDELIKIEYNWLNYVQPEINIYENKRSSRSSIDNQYILEAGFQDPLSQETLILAIKYQLGTRTYSENNTRRLDSSLHIVGEYQRDSNNQITNFKMLSLNNTLLEASLSNTSYNDAYIVRASSPYVCSSSGGVDFGYSWGLSIGGASISFSPTKSVVKYSGGDLALITGDQSIKAIRATNSTHLERYNSDVVNLNVDFRSNSNTTLYGTIKVRPQVMLFGQTYIGSKSHYKGWIIR